MSGYTKIYASLIFIALINVSSIASFAQKADDYYSLGKQAAAMGNTQKALDIWMQGKGALDLPDVRIGIAFIELVSEKNIEDYYEIATLMYQWGLSAEKFLPNPGILEDEIERLKILVDYGTYRQWWKLWKNKDPQLYKELLRFWEQLDPTPGTSYNERLIEHWERIAYSHEHFNRSKSGAFKADDRAEIYVRYGKPDFTKNGFLNFYSTTAASYIERIANTPIIPFPPPVSHLEVQAYVQNAKNYYTRPEYEIWVYRETASRPSKTIFVFGDEGNTGTFGLVESVEDFIPNAAFSISQRTLPGWNGVGNSRVDNIRPGLILQIVYYDQLSTADHFFGNMFETITSRAINTGSTVSPSLGQEMQTKAWSELVRLKEKAPQQASTYSDQIAAIPIQVYQYRLLDEQNNPYFATFVESNPHKAFLIDYLANYGGKDSQIPDGAFGQNQYLTNYEYTHGMRLFDESAELKDEMLSAPDIAANEGSSSATLFEIPFLSKGARQVFWAKLENKDPSSAYVVEDLPFLPSLRGLGKLEVEQPVPLDSNSEHLQMGDIILGYGLKGPADQNIPFPFIVANRKKIPINEDLIVHFEVYHLKENLEGTKRYTLSYEVSRREGILGWLKKDEQDLSLTLNFETKKTRYAENLQIKTRALKPGRYNLKVVVQDQLTQERAEGKFEFEVVENK